MRTLHLLIILTQYKCKYGAQTCWYQHNLKTNNEQNDVNQEVIEKLFKMMEQFTERIIDLENKTKSQ